MTPIRLGTRRSALATAQASQFAAELTAATGREVELVLITSEGDTSRASLSQMGGTGVFATRLREALLNNECDILVHSLKDLPVQQPAGLVIGATPVRADARDVLVTRDGLMLEELPAGAVIGTGSPRRAAQIARVNQSVVIRDIRGNIDSRLQRVREGELDALVLAAAGLSRLDAVGELVAVPFDLEQWPTAPGQGSLAVELRADAPPELHAQIALMDDLPTRLAVSAERQVLASLEAGCHAPVAAAARFVADRDEMLLAAVVYDNDGEKMFAEVDSCSFSAILQVDSEYARRSDIGNGADLVASNEALSEALALGDEIAGRLLRAGAGALIPRRD